MKVFRISVTEIQGQSNLPLVVMTKSLFCHVTDSPVHLHRKAAFNCECGKI